MHWHLSYRADPLVVPLADRHYSRQTIGSPQFVPPGACVVLRTANADAYWVTSAPKGEFVQHAWAGAWMCSAFRNESPLLSSLLVREAVAATLAVLGKAPPQGFVTFVDPAKTRRKRDPGRCFLRAGFWRVGALSLLSTRAEYDGTSVGGLVALQLVVPEMPRAEAPVGFTTGFRF